jgi:glycine/D-amino acid oxidase-like deaminating enzyme/nitrite reductase/ring-hydroxylating ferredoxin subunit
MTIPEPDRTLPGEPVSLWLATTPATAYPALEQPLSVDVAVLGAGIVGVTAATLLREAGMEVALVDARRVLSGATGHTTAKLTALHGLIYRDLVAKHGEEKARAYAEANQWAVERVRTWVREKGIDCDLVPTFACTYAETPEQVQAVEEEIEAARRIGLPVRPTTETGLPYPVLAAVALDEQAHFHPRKYLLALLDSFVNGGGTVVEQTTALSVDDGSPCRIETDRGEIRAKHVLIATHQPFPKKGAYYAQMYLKRSFAFAVRIRGEVPRGMYISAGADFHSLRPQKVHGEDALIVGGGPHRTGQAPDTMALVRGVEDWARSHFDVEAFLYRWATQDNVTSDRLPLVGRLASDTPHLYVATGFGGWGMTNGTVAGHLLADLVLERENRWESLYDPARLGTAKKAAAHVKDAVGVAKDLMGAYDKGPPTKEAVPPGEGHIVECGFEKVAVYRDEDGRIHEMSAVCTHMQCLVRWNSAERTWDCPCHGSRFDPLGRVLHGPATRPLDPHPPHA